MSAHVFRLSVSVLVLACGSADLPDYPAPPESAAAGSVKPSPSASASGAPASVSPPSSPSPSPTPTPTVPQLPPAPPTPPVSPAPTTPPPTPPASPVLVPMHMQFAPNGDWLMSRLLGEGAPTYQYTGVQFRVMDAAPPAVTPSGQFFRCIDPNGTHFQSVDAACEGAGTKEGVLGHVYSSPVTGTLPVHRCIAPSGRPIVSTVVLADCTNAGFIVQGTLGYAYSPK